MSDLRREPAHASHSTQRPRVNISACASLLLKATDSDPCPHPPRSSVLYHLRAERFELPAIRSGMGAIGIGGMADGSASDSRPEGWELESLCPEMMSTDDPDGWWTPPTPSTKVIKVLSHEGREIRAPNLLIWSQMRCCCAIPLCGIREGRAYVNGSCQISAENLLMQATVLRDTESTFLHAPTYF